MPSFIRGPLKETRTIISIANDDPIALVQVANETVITVTCAQVYGVHQRLPAEKKYLKLDNLMKASRRLGEPLEQEIVSLPGVFAVVPDHRAVFACGYWDNSFKKIPIEIGFKLPTEIVVAGNIGKTVGNIGRTVQQTVGNIGRSVQSLFSPTVQSLFSHTSILTCIACTEDGRSVVAGSRDATLTVWDLVNRPQWQVATQPKATLVGHTHAISCVAVSAAMDLVVSGSHGICLVHSLAGEYIRSLQHPVARRPQLLAVTRFGDVIVHYRDRNAPVLATFSMNGTLQANVTIKEQLMDMKVSKDGRFLVTGGFGNTLVVRMVHNLEIVHQYQPCESSIRSFDIAPDQQTIWVGLASGDLMVVNIDFSTWRTLCLV